MATDKNVYQFKITLEEIEPKIWRQIQVPENYSFWDLHVAIQDAMGWLDYHLHEFIIIDPRYGEKSHIGIPDEEEGSYLTYNTDPGWKRFIRHYFSLKNFNKCQYTYDFGDDWVHKIKLEKILPAIPGCKYPICLDGERACPPEDCGGTGGYENLLEIIKDQQHEEHESMLTWVGGKFDPEKFNPQEINFADPRERWKTAFEF
jgi:hypothetical protein